MQYYEHIRPVNAPGGTAVALGYFDGVHLGHRAVISAAVEWAAQNGAEPGVFTFGLPPHSPVKGMRILSTPEKHRRVQALGVRYYMAPRFEEFRTLSPEDFVFDVLKKQYGARAVFCGDNFTFGKNKAGNVDVLRRLCAGAGVAVHIVPMTLYEGEAVSSTRIRAALEAGDMPLVNAMLGAPYCVDLPVCHGTGRGHVWGFPTINQLYPDGMLMPKQGVYITRVLLPDGSVQPGATGLGTRPTVSGEGITCETFMPRFSGDVYGDEVRLEFCRYLKPTVRFDSVDGLKAYVMDAAEQALRWFDEKGKTE